MFKPTAKVLAHSVTNYEPQELVTMELTFHRYVLAEFNTHRAFSRNGASSRAIPVKRLIATATTAGVQPPVWGMNQPGMQSTMEAASPTKEDAKVIWEQAKAGAIEAATKLAELGIHKQVVNRVLEPFLPQTMLVTGLRGAWDGFFSQRLHPDAAPEMFELAKVAYVALVASAPKRLEAGEWHLPYYNLENDNCYPLADVVRACVGRCARVSYLNHDGKPDVEADIALFLKLAKAEPPHLSPFEHVAVVADQPLRASGNFSGSRWLQLRHNAPYLTTLV
jgi:thymidylate synthase ThyX